jgi:hypothetical protein
MGSLNRTVIAPLSSAIITVMVAGVVVAGVDRVDRSQVKEGTARLEASGLVEVSVGGAPFIKASHGRTLGAKDQVRVVDGSAVLDLPHSSKVELRSGSQVTVNGTTTPEVSLDQGDLLVEAGQGDTVSVDGGVSLVSVAGDAKLRRGVSLAAGVYEGTARLQRNEQGLSIPQYRQAAVVGTGIMPQAPEPLSLSPTDEWDRRLLGPVMALDEQLTLFAHTFEASAPASPDPDFYKAISPTVAALPITPQLIGGRAPGENLIGLTLVGLDSKGTFVDRFQQVFGFRAQGASWGLVAADQAINANPVLGDLESALGKLAPSATPGGSSLAAGPGGSSRSINIGDLLGSGAPSTGTTGAKGTGTPTSTGMPGGSGGATVPGGAGGSGGSGGTGGSGGSGSGGNGGSGGGKQKLINIPPTGTFLDPILSPILNPVEDLLSGLLGGLLGQGTPATGTTPTTPATRPATVPATVPATTPATGTTSGTTGSGTTGSGSTGSTSGSTSGSGSGSVSTGTGGTTATGSGAGTTSVGGSSGSPTSTTTTSPGLLGGILGGLTKTVGGLL